MPHSQKVQCVCHGCLENGNQTLRSVGMAVGGSGRERPDYRQGCPPWSPFCSCLPSLSSHTSVCPCCDQVTDESMIHALEKMRE